MQEQPESVIGTLEGTFADLRRARENFTAQLAVQEAGTILAVGAGVARIAGLPRVGFEELIRFPGDLFGLALSLDEEGVDAILLGEYEHLQAGDSVERTGRVMDVPVGVGLLGRVIDPLGRPLDGQGPIASERRLPLEREAPRIIDR